MWNGREARAEVGRLALQVRPGKKVLAQLDGGGRGEQEKWMDLGYIFGDRTLRTAVPLDVGLRTNEKDSEELRFLA